MSYKYLVAELGLDSLHFTQCSWLAYNSILCTSTWMPTGQCSRHRLASLTPSYSHPDVQSPPLTERMSYKSGLPFTVLLRGQLRAYVCPKMVLPSELSNQNMRQDFSPWWQRQGCAQQLYALRYRGSMAGCMGGTSRVVHTASQSTSAVLKGRLQVSRSLQPKQILFIFVLIFKYIYIFTYATGSSFVFYFKKYLLTLKLAQRNKFSCFIFIILNSD